MGFASLNPPYTLYISAFGVLAELVGPGTGAARWNDYLSVGNVKVGLRVTEVSLQTVSTRYFHTDQRMIRRSGLRFADKIMRKL